VVEVRSAATGEPLTNATVSLLKQDDFLIHKNTGGNGTATFRFVPHGPDELQVGVTGHGLLPAFSTVDPTE